MIEKKKKNLTGIMVRIISFLIILAFSVAIMAAIPAFRRGSGRIREEVLEATVREYAVRCYATEGSYPPSIWYLADNYGLIIDEEHYVYYYEAFSANFMPDIEVYSKRKRK